jgi:hypothetical protein
MQGLQLLNAYSALIGQCERSGVSENAFASVNGPRAITSAFGWSSPSIHAPASPHVTHTPMESRMKSLIPYS